MSGLTSRLYRPDEDQDFPTMQPYTIGLTNLAPRPTREATELAESELIAGAPLLVTKVRTCRPRAVGFVGKGIGQAFLRAVKQAQQESVSVQKVQVQVPATTPLAWAPMAKQDDGYGLMRVCVRLTSVKPEGDEESRSIVLFWSGASTSARVTSLQLPEKAAWFGKLRDLLDYLNKKPNDDRPALKTVELDVIPP